MLSFFIRGCKRYPTTLPLRLHWALIRIELHCIQFAPFVRIPFFSSPPSDTAKIFHEHCLTQISVKMTKNPFNQWNWREKSRAEIRLTFQRVSRDASVWRRSVKVQQINITIDDSTWITQMIYENWSLAESESLTRFHVAWVDIVKVLAGAWEHICANKRMLTPDGISQWTITKAYATIEWSCVSGSLHCLHDFFYLPLRLMKIRCFFCVSFWPKRNFVLMTAQTVWHHHQRVYATFYLLLFAQDNRIA